MNTKRHGNQHRNICTYLPSYQCDKLWRNFPLWQIFKNILMAIFECLFNILQNVEPTLENLCAFGPIFNGVNDHIVQKQFCHLVTLLPTHLSTDRPRYVRTGENWLNKENFAVQVIKPFQLLLRRSIPGDLKCSLRQCDQIWRNFATLAQILKNLGDFEWVQLVFAKILSLIWLILSAIWQIIFAENGKF